jgi:hypothetical protein
MLAAISMKKSVFDLAIAGIVLNVLMLVVSMASLGKHV